MLRKSAINILLTVLLTIIGVAIHTTILLASSSTIQGPYVEEFSVDVSPLNVVTSETGEIWFTAPTSNMIGKLVVTSTIDFEVQTFVLPNPSSQPYDLAYRDGFIWFTQKSGNRIGQLDTSNGNIEEFTIPTADSEPTGIAVAPDGSVWFAESKGNKLGKLNPANAVIQEYLYSVANAGFEDVAIESDGDVWLSSPTLNRAIFFNISRNQFFIVPTGLGSNPIGVAVDARNELWISIQNPSSVGRYAPGTLALWRWFETPTVESDAVGVATFKTGNQLAIAYAEQTANQMGLLVLNSNSQEVVHLEAGLLTPNGMPWGITVDSQGGIWVAATGTYVIARWKSPYYFGSYLPIVAR